MRVAGLGFRNGAGAESLFAALNAAGGEGVTHLATVEAKAGAACLKAMAQQLGLPVCAVNAAELAEADVVTRSHKSVAMYGTGSVSEAAALVAAGPGARLVVTRVLSDDRMASCAIAQSAEQEARS